MNNKETYQLKIIELSDLDSVAKLHLNSFPNSLLSLLGVESVIKYYRWQFDSGAEIYPLGMFVENKLIGYCIGGNFKAALGGFLGQNKLFHAVSILRNPKVILNKRFISNIYESLRLSIKFSSKKKN